MNRRFSPLWRNLDRIGHHLIARVHRLIDGPMSLVAKLNYLDRDPDNILHNLMEQSAHDLACMPLRWITRKPVPWSFALRTFAIVTICNRDENLLRHWLRYYTRLGVGRLIVGVCNTDPAPIRAQCVGYRATVMPYVLNPWSDGGQIVKHVELLRAVGAIDSDWILWTDLDELHEFPAPLRQIIAAAEARRIDVVKGHLVDRLTADGALIQAQPEPSLFEQFPVATTMTGDLMGGCMLKVMLARLHCPVADGHHDAVGRSGAPIGTFAQYRVHHFKWRSGLIERLSWTLSKVPDAERTGWAGECRTLLSHIKANGGRVKIEEPEAMRQAPWSAPRFEAHLV